MREVDFTYLPGFTTTYATNFLSDTNGGKEVHTLRTTECGAQNVTAFSKLRTGPSSDVVLVLSLLLETVKQRSV